MRLNRACRIRQTTSVPRRVRSTWAHICACAGPGAGPRWGTLAVNCVADDRHRRPLADRGSPGRTHGTAVTNPRIRVCSTVVLTALPPAPRTRSILPQPVPDNGIAHPRQPSLTTNIRVPAEPARERAGGGGRLARARHERADPAEGRAQGCGVAGQVLSGMRADDALM